MTEVTEDQFAWDGDELTHKPTGARFHARSEFVNYGRAGELLENGECYEREDVLIVANDMVLEKKRSEGGP